MRSALLAGFLALALFSSACVEVERRVEVTVTPGEVPLEIEGARWASLPVHYCIVPDARAFVDSDRFAELVAGAFESWGANVISDGVCDEVAQGNDRNEITWGEPQDAGVEAPHGGVFQAGFTRQLFRACDGPCPSGATSEIVEADILIAPSPPEDFENEDCLFSTILHETGHFLGVAHLDEPAVMAPATSECPQDLTASDQQALADLYGEDLAGR